jgi:hypothetical protein
MCETTFVRNVSVHVSGSSCSKCSASSSARGGNSFGANSYGGSMSVLYVGAYSWSMSFAISSNSSGICAATTALDVSVHVNGSSCSDCRAMSTTNAGNSQGANSYGGSMSVMHVGAYSWSESYAISSNSSSICGEIEASKVSVQVSGLTCFDCSASTFGSTSLGANSYGGVVSTAIFAAYSYSYAAGSLGFVSSARSNGTHVSQLMIMISNARLVDSMASSGKYFCPVSNKRFDSRHFRLDDSFSRRQCGFNSAVMFCCFIFWSDRMSQVYGGAISVMVGPYVWSFIGTGSSSATCGNTTCSNCSVVVDSTSITNGHSLSSTSGNFNP